MKNLKSILVFAFAVSLMSSCGVKETPVVVEADKIIETAHSQMNDLPVVSEFSNPGFMAGSSFGDFFITMLKTQNYNMALKFTSKESIDKFGEVKILEKYKDFKYSYKLTQKSITKEGSIFTISYTTNEFATSKIKQMNVVVENDSCKLILPNNLDYLLK